MALLNYFPLIIWAGAGLLGWIAGDVISDPIVADYAASFGAGAPAKIRLALARAVRTARLLAHQNRSKYSFCSQGVTSGWSGASFWKRSSSAALICV